MGTGEKIIIFLVVAVLAIVGITTLSSQINNGSAFGSGSSSAKTVAQPASQIRYATVTDRLNLRPGPNQNNTPIDALPAGTRVRVLSVSNGWAKIIDHRNREGYVSNDFLQY